MAASRSFCVHSVLARLKRFSSFCMSSQNLLGSGELPSIEMPDMAAYSLRQSYDSLMINQILNDKSFNFGGVTV